MTSLLDELRRLPDVEEAPSQFHGQTAFWIDGREFLHFHGEETVEIRLTRKLIRDVEDERVAHRSRTSDWLIVPARERALVLRLARQALEANRR